MRRVARRAWAVALVLLSALGGCKAPGDVRVTSLSFAGTHAVSESELESVLTTKASGWLPWSEKQYFDRQEFDRDLARIQRYYQDRGYPDARIADVDVALNDRRDAVKLTITVNEGQPVIATGVRYDGFDVLSERLRRPLDAAPLKAGEACDQAKVSATRQLAVDLLHDHGYAYAAVQAVVQPGGDAHRVTVLFQATPGPPTVFGPISYEGLSRLTTDVVGRQLSFETGDEYRRNLVLQSQRRLGSLEIIQFVNVNATPPDGAAVREIPVTVTIAENPPRHLQLGVGYGSEERLRGSAQWSHLNFLGNARNVTTEARYSSIDRGVRASLTQPYLYRRGLSLELSASDWWTDETQYQSHTYGGRIGVAYRVNRATRGTTRAPGDVLRLFYVHEYSSYSVPPGVLADPSYFATLIALGLNPFTGTGNGTTGAIAAEYQRNAADNLLNPHRGYALNGRVESAHPWLGGTFKYTEYAGEVREYVPAGSATVAVRAHYATLDAEQDSDVPFSSRYYLGGSTSLRGWGRFQVAPLQDGLPFGGRTVFDMSGELRVVVRGPIGAVAFVDGGNAQVGSWAAPLNELRWDAGAGLRYSTPIGLLRADIARQLNPIPGLLVNGEPETRHWRAHVSIGQAF